MSLLRLSRGYGSLSVTPKALRCNVRAFAHGFELLPYDCAVDLRAIERLGGEAAIRGRHDVLPSNQICKPDDSLRYPLWMLHNVTGVRDHAGAQDFAFRQLQTFKEMIFVFMARV